MTEASKKNRINFIIEAVRKAAEGDFSSRIAASGKKDDIDRLADAINQMVEIMDDHIAAKKQVESALSDSEEKYRRLKANIPGMIYLFAMHPDGTFSFPYVNDASRQLFDIDPEDLMRDATLITRLIHPDDVERFDLSVKRSAEMLQPWREVLRHIVNGEVRWYDCMSRPELQASGDILWDGIILEITDRMKANESLRESQTRLSEIISASPVGIGIYDGSGQCIATNDSLAQIIGATQQQVLEQNYGKIESWKKSGLLDMARAAVRTQSAKRHEVVTISTFGKEVFLDCHLVPLGEKDLLFMAQDITEHKQTEDSLKKALRSLTNSQKLAKVGSWDWDIQKGDVEWSDEVYRIFGLDPEEFHPQIDSIMNRFHPEDRNLHESLIAKVIANREPYTFEARITLPNGNTHFLISTSEGHFDGKGNLIQISGTVQDITERKRAEDKLRINEERLKQAVRVGNIGIFDHDHIADTYYWSAELLQIYGLDETPTLQEFINLIHAEDRERIAAAVRRAHDPAGDGFFDVEFRGLRLDGATRWTATRSQTFFDGEGDARRPIRTIGAVRDITEEKLAEEALHQAKVYAENLVESANAMIVVLNAEGQIQVFNKAAEEITGYPRQELIGHNWFEILVPKDKYPHVWEAFKKSARDGLPPSFENPILTKAGEQRFISWQNTELLENGVYVGSISYGIDITERKQLEDQLLQSQKMEAIGQLTGGIAHDFNNMLSVILGHAELVKSSLPSGHPLLKNVLEIEKAGVHSRDITRQLLAFSRKQIIAPKTTNLNQLIMNIKKTLSQLIGENIDLRFFQGKDLWKVRFDPSQIDQILINLAVNARDAMPDRGMLTIETSNVYLDEVYCSLHVDCRPGHFVLLLVSDDGAGMDQEMLSHVFEPFFTTKEVGKGTGLGLATVYGIVKQNGGFINVYSEPQKGTTFKIYIPRIMDEDEEGKSAAETSLQFRSGTVLLVEDDDMVRKMTSAILEKIGYTVVTAETPLAALAFFEKEDTPIDLLITDVVMPQMSGMELNDKIKAIRPGIKVLFMSGYTENVVVRQGVLKEDVHFVQKPFSMNDFARKVREAIEDELV